MMARKDWILIGWLLFVCIQLGSAVEDVTESSVTLNASTIEYIPEDAVLLNGDCSTYAFISCVEGTSGCVDLDDGRYYCKCLQSELGDGLKNGTGCGDKKYICHDPKEDCHAYAVCENNTCICKEGFDGDGAHCKDIDECLEDPCVPNSNCKNLPGSHECHCKEQFVLIDEKCLFSCRANSECHGIGECIDDWCRCPEGYIGDGINNCDDIDECANNTFECDQNASCRNLNGSYACDCNNGHAGDGKTCAELPRSCEEIYEKDNNSPSGSYTIDADGPGPIESFQVMCEMRDNMGITAIYPVVENIRHSPDGGSTEEIVYTATPEQINLITNGSNFCSQEFWAKCKSMFNLQSFMSWEDSSGAVRTGWGTEEEGKCPCGVLGVCKNHKSPCNCDGSYPGIDTGYIIDKSILPATKVIIGNTMRNTDWALGPVKCGRKPFDILKDCDQIRQDQGVKVSGPQLIDVDGADLPLEPVLVYCDMDSFPKLGLTVIKPIGSPEVEFTESGSRPVNYRVPLPVIEALVKGAVHCDQTFEYECQNGRQTVTVNVGADDRTLDYLPGGIPQVPGSCGCGVTKSCDDITAPCNCAIDDGRTRRDIGVQIDRDDLPIVTVSAAFTGQNLSGQAKGVSFVGPLRCSGAQFGIESNCEKYRSIGATANYTYLIDPDGPPKAGIDNLVPFRVLCIMQTYPAMGITTIYHSMRNVTKFGAGNLTFDLTYESVSPEQLQSLKERCTYVQQSVKLSCNKFALHPPSGTSYFAYWLGILNQRKRYYWSGDGSKGNCDGVNGEDVCRCDSSEGTDETMIDMGELSNKAHIPVSYVNFEQANIDNNGYVEMELGPFQCFEIFPTCAVVFSSAKARQKYGESIPEDGRFTIDPDGSGGVEAFEVDCDFPFTNLPVEKPVNSLDNDGTEPVTKCFDINYMDSRGNTLNSSQVIELVKASNGNCKQSLSLTCQNAPITDMIYFKTCGKGKQTGWVGSGGADSCACGVTGTCYGDVNTKCNCDNEDGEIRIDSGTIIDNARLPLCEVCITLNGTKPNPGNPAPPARSASFRVSELQCSKHKLGVSRSCQDARLGSAKGESATIYIEAQPEPIPVYCDFRPYPPVGVLQVFPQKPNITVDPNEPLDEFIVYKVFKMSQLLPLINKFDYCTQRLEITCQDASLAVQGEFGWYNRDSKVQSYWNNPGSGGPCVGNDGQCNCNLPGTQVDGGLIIDQTALPITRIKFAASAGTRNIFIGPLECYDIKKDCKEIMDSKDLGTVYWGNSSYPMDPDGPGPVEPFIAVCEFKQKENNAITIVYPITKFPYRISNTGSNPFEIPISYIGATPEQLNALAKHSEFCFQGVRYECKESPVGNFTLADRSIARGFGLADDLTTIGCPCGKLNTCESENNCRCDAMESMLDFDEGIITAKDVLPITDATFGDQESPDAVGRLTVTELRCSPKPDGIPKTCQEAAEMGMASGEILINPSEDIPPFLVFCEITPGRGIAIVKPVPEPDQPVTSGQTDVEYYGLTDKQLKVLTNVSDYCYQPVLIDCYSTGLFATDVFYWSGPDESINIESRNEYWGSGSPSEQTCSCGAEHRCGGDGNKAVMSQTKCNCDIGDEEWRKDGGILRVKEDLPVRKYYYNLVGAKAKANMTIGDLYCGMQEIDLPVCTPGFDDCSKLAVCQDKSVSSFTCECLEGYRGRVKGKTSDDIYANGRECFDNDECSFKPCHHSASCSNFPGDFNCTCSEGYKAKGKTDCEDIDECDTDEHDCDVNARCENVEGSFNCKCNRGYVGNGRTCEPQGQCACFGDPHCLTYDEEWVHFMGLCEYTMSRDNCDGGDPTFEVIIKNWNKNIQDSKASWVKEVLIKFQGTRVELRQGKLIFVDDRIKSAYAEPHLTVFDYGNEVRLTTSTGLTVTWDGEDAVQVNVGKYYKGKLCGICGNYNDDKSDDFRVGPSCPNPGPLPITTNVNLFTNSWSRSVADGGDPSCKVDCNDKPPNNPKCLMSPRFASMLCDSILNRAFSIFSICIPKLDPRIMEGFYVSCKMDMCLSPTTTMNNVCGIAARVAKECKNIGESVPYWKQANGLKCGDDTCGDNMESSLCGGMANPQNRNPGPIQTCINFRMGRPPTPSPECLQGCFCEKGYYLEGDKCVPEDECGCIYEDENGKTSYLKTGEVDVNEGCGSYRVCTEGNVFESESLVCDANATCNLDSETGIYGCHCKDGFMGDGETCKVDPCFNHNCSKNQECKDGECVCKMGYTGNCEQCVDINECKTATHNCTKLGNVCVNTDGSFYCDCDEGYLNLDGLCIDFDECENDMANCPTHSICKNTKGGFECLCCAGFKKENAVCVPDNSGLAAVGDRSKCCSCFGEGCDTPGKVCGTDGKTYNSEKELRIKSCKNSSGVKKSYDGPCRGTCEDIECTQPLYKCRVEDGKADCGCPQCTESEFNTTIESVCSSTHLMFKSTCDFNKYACGMADSEITIVSTGKECNSTGPGQPIGQWTPWSNCSEPCGEGYTFRTRVPIAGALDANGKEIKETTIAKCYTTCPKGPCKNTTCPAQEVCTVGENNQPECKCPDCKNRGDDPVCGKVGRFIKTYKNLCELEKDACFQAQPMTMLQNYPCEVEPEKCARKFKVETKTDYFGCKSIDYDFGQCVGGCGDDPSECCTETYEEVTVPVQCKGSTAYEMAFKKVASCTCKKLDQGGE